MPGEEERRWKRWCVIHQLHCENYPHQTTTPSDEECNWITDMKERRLHKGRHKHGHRTEGGKIRNSCNFDFDV